MKNGIIIIIILLVQFLKMSLCWDSFTTDLSQMTRLGMRILMDFWTDSMMTSFLMHLSFLLQLIEKCVGIIENTVTDLPNHDCFDCDIRHKNYSVSKMKLNKCIELYSYACDLHHDLSYYYSPSMLLWIIIIFTLSLVFLYTFVQLWLISNVFSECVLFQMFILIFPLFWLTTRVSALLNEVKTLVL